MGIGYAPSWLFEDEIARGEVIRVLPDWSVRSPIHIVMPQERRHSAKVRAFSDHLAQGWGGV
jgi:DNA-binding transcriptional LysR family regulator